jgi:hypothetical protein
MLSVERAWIEGVGGTPKSCTLSQLDDDTVATSKQLMVVGSKKCLATGCHTGGKVGYRWTDDGGTGVVEEGAPAALSSTTTQDRMIIPEKFLSSFS